MIRRLLQLLRRPFCRHPACEVEGKIIGDKMAIVTLPCCGKKTVITINNWDKTAIYKVDGHAEDF